jgi:large repetitive protein
VLRFSTKEGVLWIQAQLTDNSWLLDESVRLTGGFAFVTWYKGQYAGQFVLTMGGYHPSFQRDGYPQVPRLGFCWSVSDAICIKGESYFALTSEAVMAGGRLEASAQFGPASAHIVFGADGIIYFDPFRYELDVYARISAGVTIDVWIGEITISISIGAQLHLEGPKFHGSATFSVGPVGITVPFGETDQSAKVYLDWPTFTSKYLEVADGGGARAISAMTGAGTLAPGASGGKQDGTADGSAAKPFVVYSEFVLLVTTTVPAASFTAGPHVIRHGGAIIGIAPMNVPNAAPALSFTLRLADPVSGAPTGGDLIASLGAPAVSSGAGFPVGVWGPPQPDDDRKVPSGDTLAAIDGASFAATASITGTLPTPVKYFQVEVGDRKPLPFVPEHGQRAAFITSTGALSEFVTAVPAGQEVPTAERWLAGAGVSKLALASFEADRAAPPLLGSLSEGFLPQVVGPVATEVVAAPPPPAADLTVHPPVAIGVLAGLVASPAVAAQRTTVSKYPQVARAMPADLEAVRARTQLAVPVKLVRQPAGAAQAAGTAIATGASPLTRAARGSVAQVSGRFGAGDAKRRLAGLTAGLGQGPVLAAAGAPPAQPGAQLLRPGELAVLQLPNAGFDTGDGARPRLAVDGDANRVVAMAHGGHVLADAPGSPDGRAVPPGTERLAVLAGAPVTGVCGWHSGQELAYAGWATAVVPGATVTAEGARIARSRDRYRAGWIRGAELVDGAAIVTTRFAGPVTAVAILIDDPLGTEAARGLVLSLDGAQRPVDADGRERPPAVVSLGNRSALVYTVLPDLAERIPRAVSVGVAAQAGWHLAGMLGLEPATAGPDAADAAAADLAGRLARGGIDTVVRPLVDVPAAGGGCGIQWLAPDGAPAPRPAPGPVREPAPRPVPQPAPAPVGIVPAAPAKGVEP